MAFNSMNKGQLEQVAEDFGVSLEGATNNDSRVSKILDAGVTWEMYETFKNASEENEELQEEELADYADEDDKQVKSVEKPKEEFLVKMERKNGTYSYWGQRFTRDHPFKLVDGETLAALVEHGGFRQALPKEIDEYYK